MYFVFKLLSHEHNLVTGTYGEPKQFFQIHVKRQEDEFRHWLHDEDDSCRQSQREYIKF